VQFDKHFDKIYATTFDYERAASIEQITEIAEEIGIKTEPILEPHLYVRNFIRESQNKCLIILGSIYLLGNIKTKLLNEIT
jgi:folylpolyglutamate synthase/dihydropteroate synthase